MISFPVVSLMGWPSFRNPVRISGPCKVTIMSHKEDFIIAVAAILSQLLHYHSPQSDCPEKWMSELQHMQQGGSNTLVSSMTAQRILVFRMACLRVSKVSCDRTESSLDLISLYN